MTTAGIQIPGPSWVKLAARARFVEGTRCLVWEGGKTRGGYGSIVIDGKTDFVHRIAWTLTNGPIEPGQTVDHLCRNRLCMNPDHMELVSRGENVRRGHAAGRVERAHPINFPPVANRTANEIDRIRRMAELIEHGRRFMTQDEMARRMTEAGLLTARPTISQWRHGRMCPSPDAVSVLSTVLEDLFEATS